MLLHVWVADVQVAALGASEADRRLFLLEVDVALVAHDSFRLVEWLGHAAGASEGVGARGRAHVCVLPLEGLSVNCNGPRLCVIALGHPLHQLLISGLSRASEHA